jgi:hypothetical protein
MAAAAAAAAMAAAAAIANLTNALTYKTKVATAALSR